MIAAPLVSGAVSADGLTFTARTPGGAQVRTDCPALGQRFEGLGWDVQVSNRPERPDATDCEHCDGEHR